MARKNDLTTSINPMYDAMVADFEKKAQKKQSQNVATRSTMTPQFTPLSPEAAVYAPRPSVGPVAPVSAGIVERLGSPDRLQPSAGPAAPVAAPNWPAADIEPRFAMQRATGQSPEVAMLAGPAAPIVRGRTGVVLGTEGAGGTLSDTMPRTQVMRGTGTLPQGDAGVVANGRDYVRTAPMSIDEARAKGILVDKLPPPVVENTGKTLYMGGNGEMYSDAARNLAAEMGQQQYVASHGGWGRFRNLADEGARSAWQQAYERAAERFMSPQQKMVKQYLDNQRAIQEGAAWRAGAQGQREQELTKRDVGVAREQAVGTAGKRMAEEARLDLADRKQTEAERKSQLADLRASRDMYLKQAENEMLSDDERKGYRDLATKYEQEYDALRTGKKPTTEAEQQPSPAAVKPTAPDPVDAINRLKVAIAAEKDPAKKALGEKRLQELQAKFAQR